MGCVVYYVLTSGRHPFGSSLRRQANIESDYYDLSDLSGIGMSQAMLLLPTYVWDECMGGMLLLPAYM